MPCKRSGWHGERRRHAEVARGRGKNPSIPPIGSSVATFGLTSGFGYVGVRKPGYSDPAKKMVWVEFPNGTYGVMKNEIMSLHEFMNHPMVKNGTITLKKGQHYPI